jgi:hypothetical protein
MSQLFYKSKINFDSAKLLIERGYDVSSIHCLYYSSFQLLKYVIALTEGVTYEELEIERNTLMNEQKKNIGTHEFLINRKFLNLLHREKSHTRYVNELNQLKTLRRRADYENLEITGSDSNKALKISQKISDKLNEFL